MEHEPRASVQYETPPPFMTRGKYLVLLSVMLLNTLLLITSYAQPLASKGAEWIRRLHVRPAVAAPAPVVPPAGAVAATPPAPADEAIMFEDQTRWMAFAMPADQIVYDENPASASSLLRQEAYSACAAWGPGGEPFKNWQPPACRDVPGSCYWLEHGPGCATLFLHERTNKAGFTRLVHVTMRPGVAFSRAGNGYEIQLQRSLGAEVWMPGSPVVKPEKCANNYSVFLGRARALTDSLAPSAGVKTDTDGESAPLRLYAGQPDPNDPSRFTISYTLGDKSGTIQCQLDERDCVCFNGANQDALSFYLRGGK